MSPITIIMLSFSMLGAVDLIIGNKLGLGKEFERGIHLLGILVMSMVGMIVFAPVIAHLLRPAIEWVCSVLPIEPSVIPSMILANDMGGAPLAMEFATNEKVGYFNGLIVSAMMGVTISLYLTLCHGRSGERETRFADAGLALRYRYDAYRVFGFGADLRFVDCRFVSKLNSPFNFRRVDCYGVVLSAPRLLKGL